MKHGLECMKGTPFLRKRDSGAALKRLDHPSHSASEKGSSGKVHGQEIPGNLEILERRKSVEKQGDFNNLLEIQENLEFFGNSRDSSNEMTPSFNDPFVRSRSTEHLGHLESGSLFNFESASKRRPGKRHLFVRNIRSELEEVRMSAF